MEDITGIIRLAGVYGLILGIIYIAYLFYDKNFFISVALLIIGVVLAASVILNEIQLKIKESEEFKV